MLNVSQLNANAGYVLQMFIKIVELEEYESPCKQWISHNRTVYQSKSTLYIKRCRSPIPRAHFWRVYWCMTQSIPSNQSHHDLNWSHVSVVSWHQSQDSETQAFSTSRDITGTQRITVLDLIKFYNAVSHTG